MKAFGTSQDHFYTYGKPGNMSIFFGHRAESRRRRGHRARRDGGPIMRTWSVRVDRAAHARIQPPSMRIPCVQPERGLLADRVNAGDGSAHAAMRPDRGSGAPTRAPLLLSAVACSLAMVCVGPLRCGRLPRSPERCCCLMRLTCQRSSRRVPIVRGKG